jgi:cytochrome P450
MIDEAQTIVAAGTVTITHMLSVTVFHILDNPHVAQKLKEELHAATIPSRSIPLAQLQKLPYLTAIIREGFRMGYGVSHRLQRIKPDGSLPFHHWLIPAGTPVSMSSVFMHDNPTIFPQPHEFRPERWLGDGVRLEKYLVPFSRGTRACIGINLAYAEMYLTLATVFRRFDLELFETTRADVDLAHDFFNACPRLDSKGVRVMAKSTALRE